MAAGETCGQPLIVGDQFMGMNSRLPSERRKNLVVLTEEANVNETLIPEYADFGWKRFFLAHILANHQRQRRDNPCLILCCIVYLGFKRRFDHRIRHIQSRPLRVVGDISRPSHIVGS